MNDLLLKMHVKFFVSRINKSYIRNFLKLNFHSRNSIYSSQWFACRAFHILLSDSHVIHPLSSFFQMRPTNKSESYFGLVFLDILLFSDFRFYGFIDIFGFYLFI